MANTLTDDQMSIAIAVLANNVTVPFINGQANGMYRNGGNQITIPLSAFNTLSGANLTASADGVNIYLQLNEGQPASGA